MNIIQSIELCDLSQANARLREETCEKVLKGLEDIKHGQMACNSVKEALIALQRGELEQKDITLWNDTFVKFKILWENIDAKRTETDLNNDDRIANLRLLEGLLFSVRITILVLLTETECDACCAESFKQLISLVEYVRQAKATRFSNLNET